MMQHVAEQDGVHRSVRDWKMFAVELFIVNRRFGSRLHIDPNHVRAKHCREVMSDEAVAAANVEYARIDGNCRRDLERHVIGPAHAAATARAKPAASSAIQQNILSPIGDKESLLLRCDGFTDAGRGLPGD